MGLGQRIGNPFVRNPRQDQRHLHASLRRKLERRLHLPVQDQIRCHDMYVLKRPVQHIHIHPLPHLILVQRPVAVGNHIPFGIPYLQCGIGQKRLKLSLSAVHHPHLQKHQGKALHRLPFQHDCSILPVPEFHLLVDIFVRQIDPAVKSCMPVDHEYLPMVTVIIVRGDKRRDRRKGSALDPQPAQTFRIVMGQQRKLAGAVIHHAHIHALCRFPRQDLKHPAPHQSLPHNKVLHKDKMLRRFQFPQHCIKLVLTQREVCDCSLIIYRMAAASANIMGQRRHAAVLLLQTRRHRLILPDTCLRVRDHLACPLL